MTGARSIPGASRLRRVGGELLRHALSYAPRFVVPQRKEFAQACAELRESEYWSAGQLRELADARLRDLVAYAVRHVPYYRELFARERLDPREIQGVGDLPKIPVLTREILLERFDDLKSDEFERHRPILGQSGGSTGKRRQFWLSQRSFDLELAAAQRHYRAAGYRDGDRCAALYFPLEGELAERLYWDKWQSRMRCLNTRLLSRERLHAMVGAAVSFRAKVLWAYPSHLELFVRYVEETGDDRFRPRAIVTNAEVLYEHQREHARRVLGCDVFDWYGLGEHVAAAAECERHGYHIPEEIVAVEIIAGGREAPGDEPGEIVGTCFENYAQPLIRYRTGDYAVRRHDRCSCGRSHAMLREIGGRTQDIVSTPEGGWRAFRHGLFGVDEVPGLHAVQLEQVEVRRFVVRAVAPEGLSEEARVLLERRVVEAIGFDAAIEIVLVEDIPRTERGKRRLVISRVPFTMLDAPGSATVPEKQ
ncbi:MAG: phenylacetate--CoA ligase family protein [Steroidobacteraceae bacterium]